MIEQFFLGYPVEFKKLCLVYPPKVKDVVSNIKYGIYAKLLTLSQEEIEDQFVEKGWDLKELLTPFEFMLNNAFHDKAMEQITKESFEFFIHESVTLLYEEKAVVIGDIKEINGNNRPRTNIKICILGLF